MFKLGLDLDGVITRHPDHLRFLADRLLMSGHEVLIITGRMEHERGITLKQLKDLHFRFTELVMYPKKYIFEKGVVEIADMAEIGKWKAEVCKTKRIDLLLEDSNHWYYGADFPSPRVHI